MANTTDLHTITATFGHGRVGQIECLTAAYITAVRNWHTSQLQMFKDDYENTAAILINHYHVSPSGLQETFDRITSKQ